MGPTTVTSIVLGLVGLALLTMASWAWFGDWEPQPRRSRAESQMDLEVARLRRAIDTYEREQSGRRWD